VVTNRANHINPRMPDRAISEGDVTLLGAENLLPGSATRYRVQLGWMREGKEWKLMHLKLE
jgi:hypothetical protein